MNIIYLLTNKSKTSGMRFYIGSKTECAIRNIDGIDTIVSLNSNLPYYSSSSNIIFKNDFSKGDIFEASILESNVKRDELLKTENNYILKFDAVNSDEYYNLSEARIGYNYKKQFPKNLYNETIGEFAKNQSSCSKRDNRAKILGFIDYSYLACHIYEQFLLGKTYTQISKDLGMERHFAGRYLKNWDMEKAIKEIASNLDPNLVRDLVLKGVSLKKISEILKIEEVTTRRLLGDFSKENKGFSVARQMNLTADELGLSITRDIVKNNLTISECAKKYALTNLNVQRYFIRYVQKRLELSDL